MRPMVLNIRYMTLPVINAIPLTTEDLVKSSSQICLGSIACLKMITLLVSTQVA